MVSLLDNLSQEARVYNLLQRQLDSTHQYRLNTLPIVTYTYEKGKYTIPTTKKKLKKGHDFYSGLVNPGLFLDPTYH